MEFPKVTIIMRGYTYEQIKNVLQLLVDTDRTDVYGLEITLNSPNVFETLEKITKEFGDKCLIGAGTVLNLADAKKSVQAGAKFILSPIKLTKEVLEYCKENKIISVPAAMTPTEVFELYSNGADIIKVFPARTVGAAFFNDIQAPLGEMKLMAVGGVSASNTNQYLTSGASYVGIGSGIFEHEDILAGNIKNMFNSIKYFEDQLQSTN